MQASAGQQQRNCSGCGRSIPWDANLCPYCGRDYRMQMVAPPAQLAMTEGFKVVLYILSLLVFPVGILLGFVYREKPDAESKEFGRVCLVLGFMGLILWMIFTLMWLI